MFVFAKIEDTKKTFEINWPLGNYPENDMSDTNMTLLTKSKNNLFLKFCESFLRKCLICTLTDLNPIFGGLWDMLWIFSGDVTFIMLRKKSFGQNNFWISCLGSKLEGVLSFYSIHNCIKAVYIVKLFLSSIQNGFYRLWIENQNM